MHKPEYSEEEETSAEQIPPAHRNPAAISFAAEGGAGALAGGLAALAHGLLVAGSILLLLAQLPG